MLNALRLVCSFSSMLLIAGQASAASIAYAVQNLGGNTWQYSYTVVNLGPAVGFDEFTLYFDRNLFDSLAAVSAPAGWDALVAQPDLALPSDGFYDALLSSGPLAPDATSAVSRCRSLT